MPKKFTKNLFSLDTSKSILILLSAAAALILLGATSKLSIETAGTTASILSLLVLFGPPLKESFQKARESARNSPTRRLTFLIFLLTTAICLSLAIALANKTTANFLEKTIVAHQISWDAFLFRAIVPLTLVTTIAMLFFKVKSVQTMDQQKKIIKSITRTINRWAWLNQKDAKNNPQKEKISRYSLLLEEICNKALHLASTTGNRASPPVGDLCAVLLLPDHQKEHFHATTCVGPSAFKSALINHKPPFFKPAVFRDLYNKYHSLSQKNDSPDPSELLRQFRRDSEDCISSTGVIYEIEKRISFEDLHHRCLAFRFEFMERIERAERKSYKFRQLIGIPINILGRKIGVLLLMSHRPKQFYPYDSIYWILSDLMGMAIAAGIQDPELKPFFPEDLSLEQCPFLDSEADISERREEAINVLNGVKYDFSVECP